jgi:hypothetical protein
MGMGALAAAFAGACSGFDPPLSETPSTKHQAPEKFQISNTNLQNRFRAKRRAGLSLAWSLEFGIGSLLSELLASKKLG